MGIVGSWQAVVNIPRADGEKGETRRGFISYVFNVCLPDIPASQSPALPFIFMYALSATYHTRLSRLLHTQTHNHLYLNSHSPSLHPPSFQGGTVWY